MPKLVHLYTLLDYKQLYDSYHFPNIFNVQFEIEKNVENIFLIFHYHAEYWSEPVNNVVDWVSGAGTLLCHDTLVVTRPQGRQHWRCGAAFQKNIPGMKQKVRKLTAN